MKEYLQMLSINNRIMARKLPAVKSRN